MEYSVLMSVYTKEEPAYLDTAIQSMLDQTVRTDDFVIVCDGPLTAELDAVLERHLAQNPAVLHLVRLPQNIGTGAALNIGLTHCKNELIAKMDSDDISVLDRCERQLKEFAEDDRLTVVGGNILEFTEDPAKPVSRRLVPCDNEGIQKYARRRQPFNNMTVMYKRSAVLKVGGYKAMTRSEDYDLYVRILHEGYVRLYALIRYGGVYMDTDVELVAPLDRFMNQAAFAGFEDASHVATCVMACEPEFPLFKEFLLQYSNMQFLNPDGTLNTTTNVSRLTDICLERGMLQNGQCQSVAGLTIYPADYFCPLALDTGLLKQTENTVAIHWFAGSWWSSEEKYAWKITRRLHRILPVKTAKRLGKAIAIARYRGWSSLAETFSDFCRKQRKHE